jgi:hypothetical protein
MRVVTHEQFRAHIKHLVKRGLEDHPRHNYDSLDDAIRWTHAMDLAEQYLECFDRRDMANMLVSGYQAIDFTNMWEDWDNAFHDYISEIKRGEDKKWCYNEYLRPIFVFIKRFWAP